MARVFANLMKLQILRYKNLNKTQAKETLRKPHFLFSFKNIFKW